MSEFDSEKSRRPQDRDFTVDRWEQFPFERTDDPYENRTEDRKSQPSGSQYKYEGWEQNAFPNKEPSEQHAESNDANSQRGVDIRVPSELERQVTDALATRPEIDARRIQVQVESREIVLSGFVPDRHSRQAAGEVASDASGAAPVQNRLVVDGGERR